MAFLNNIDQVRNVEWGKTYLWDIKIIGATPPFNDWFPAIDIEYERANLESYQFEAFMSSFKVPLKTTSKSLKITYLDDYKDTIQRFIYYWIQNEILNNGKFISPLEKCVKLVQVTRLNNQKDAVWSSSQWVYPEGLLSFHGSSSPDVTQLSTDFVIVG
jgi:hypothetical protein